MIKACNRIIEYSFYLLFLIVPLALWKDTSELFELNKMWLTWGLTIVIGMCWFTKMILQKKFIFQRTPLDIPIGLFLLSQFISTIFSWDFHVSLWGYYSRFNGGFLSIFSYIFLYYAFLSNSPTITKVQRLLTISLVSGLVVALWGLPSRLGYDPTCYVFRGTFDVSCWTADFMPKIRIFSTLGQPNWLAAYLAILIPISIVYFINNWKLKIGNWKLWAHLSLIALFYVDLLLTRARSGILGIWISLIFFAGLYFWLNGKPKLSFSAEKFKSPFAILFFGFLIITFILGTPFTQLRMFHLEEIKNYLQKSQTPSVPQEKTNQEVSQTPQPVTSGGTESADIRSMVWTGAINTWKNNFLIGTGVETFAYAYYKYKPVGQNLTSEWNFLYNKAHNEYLNYLATTGILGLGSYLLMIGWFGFIVIKDLRFKIKDLNKNHQSLIIALVSSYISILIINFFGFSVVITNIYLFMIPAFILVFMQQTEIETTKEQTNKTSDMEDQASIWQWTPNFFIGVVGIFMLYSLFRFWRADIAFALGYNLDRAGEYQNAYTSLKKAVELRGDEPVFKDELSINEAIIATAIFPQSDSANKEQAITAASALAQEAINLSNDVISQNANNVIFWKTRVRLFYTLSQVDARYLPRALDAIEKASFIAPQDANIWYNLGILYGQNNNIAKGIETLEKTIKLKPDYRDARYALGLFYHSLAMDEKGQIVKDPIANKKALEQMQYIIMHLNPADPGALESLKNWAQ